MVLASAQAAPAQAESIGRQWTRPADVDSQPTVTATPFAVPTVTIPRSAPVSIPTVTLPQPSPTPTVAPIRLPPHRVRVRRHHHPRHKRVAKAQAPEQWIWAYLTSYCPGSAGWLSSSGMPVFYGMLANDYYAFGTRVFIPAIGITGVVEDRIGAYLMWNHFDVWSPICYSTPTGWFKVAVAMR